ncbi:MAG: HAD-IA family hydrolase [Candidatus Micrarchaeaceae archaeon]
MPIGDYKLFIFDWDGTLSTSTMLVRASRFLQRRYNLSYIRKHFKDYEEQSRNDIKSEEEFDMIYARLYDLYSFFYKPRLQPGAAEILKELKKRKKLVAVFSDSERYRLIKEVRMLGLDRYVDFIISAASIGKYKPNPYGLILIAKHFRIPRPKAIYIGDMASDILTAKLANMDACSVCNGIDPYRLLKELRPKYLVSNLREMKSLL